MRKESIWIGNMYRINLYYIDYQIAIEKEKTMKGMNSWICRKIGHSTYGNKCK